MAKSVNTEKSGETEVDSEPLPRFSRARLVLIGGGGVAGLIVLGLGILIGRYFYPSFPSGSQTEASGSESMPFGTNLSLPQGAVVKSIALSGNELAVHYEAPDDGGIVIMNLATGRALGRLRTSSSGANR